MMRLVNKMSQDKLTGDMLVKDAGGNTILKLDITDSESALGRDPAVA
jgi:hypothetical protein